MNNSDEQVNHDIQKVADRYLLKEIIGEGSYSIVFRGYDSENYRKVAIKELKSKGLTKEEADEAQQLFFNEINMMKKLDHPNIPKVYDFFLFEGRHYMVMQWIEGKSLLSILEKGETLSQGEAIFYMRQIIDALVYLQEKKRRIVYKDLKPSNILVNELGHAWIIDFGTARFYSPEKKGDTHVLGTPGYAPPEAYTGAQTDLSADVYSLGATFFHLTTGMDPFQFKFSFPSPCKYNNELTLNFCSVILGCLKPGDMRIPNAKELKRHIQNLDQGCFDGLEEDSTDNDSTDNTQYKGCLLVLLILFVGFAFMESGTYDCGVFIMFFSVMSLLAYPAFYFITRAKKIPQNYISIPVYLLTIAILVLVFMWYEFRWIVLRLIMPIFLTFGIINLLFRKFNVKISVWVQFLLAFLLYLSVLIFLVRESL